MIDLGIGTFFSDIKNALSSARILGIDIGTTSIKLVEVGKRGEILTLENYALLETKDYLSRGNAAIQTSALRISERDVSQLLTKMIKETNLKTKNAIVSIPIYNAFFVTIDMPTLSPNEAATALKFQVKQYVPLPIDQVNIEWVKMDSFQNERGQDMSRYLIVAVPIATINTLKRIFDGVGITLRALEVEHQSFIRALLSPTDPIVQVVDIGGESTGIYIVEDGIAKRSTQIDSGGSSLTKSLARSLDISPLRAEDLKKRKGLVGSGGEYEISQALYPFLDVIFNECARIRTEFERTSRKKVSEIVLVGGGANLSGIDGYVKETTGLPVKTTDAFRRFVIPSEIESIRKQVGRTFASASGLALRYFV
jgi:type IV pilus assembly protein PilM